MTPMKTKSIFLLSALLGLSLDAASATYSPFPPGRRRPARGRAFFARGMYRPGERFKDERGQVFSPAPDGALINLTKAGLA